MTIGGITFRRSIDFNKIKVIEYLKLNGESHASDIIHGYLGEKNIRSVRNALRELRLEGKVTTDDKVYMWQGKKWSLCEK